MDKQAVMNILGAVSLATASWSLMTTITLLNEVSWLSSSKADKEMVYDMRESQAVLAEAFRNQTVILGEIKDSLRGHK